MSILDNEGHNPAGLGNAPTAQVTSIDPTVSERYEALRKNAEAFVASMTTMVEACERYGDEDLASKLKVWCLMPWQAAIRDDDSGDLWPICEACSLPIKNEADLVGSEDGCDFHKACVDFDSDPTT